MVAADRTPVVGADGTSPAVGGFAVTPHDTNDLARMARSLWVGVQGTIKVRYGDDSEDTLTAFQGLLPAFVKRVYSTGTTATGISAWY